MEDSLTVRLDEVEQELVRLLSLRSDDLQIFSSRQDQLLQSHYHSLTSALQTAQGQLEKLKSGVNVCEDKKEINERWLERQNLKKFWIYCEEIQRQKSHESFKNSGRNTDTNKYNHSSTNNAVVYQTPNTNDSTTNISKTSLTNLLSENNSENNNSNFSASQPAPEIFSDATNRLLNNPESPTKVYSASQPEPAGAGGILKKGRKSLGNGRRVSFAATAHVRVFGSEEKAAEEAARRRREAEEEAEEQRQLAEFRKQFEVPAGSNVEELKNSFNQFEIKSSPLVSHTATIDVTPSKRPFTSIDQSFDVDLKVDEQPSFSSYLSPEKDMDLTGCVGNILDDLSSPMSANSRRQSQMEFTNCVGSILAQINNAANSNEVEDEGSLDMEMTQSIGTLVLPMEENPKQQEQERLSQEQGSDNMEMTQPIGSLIIEGKNSMETTSVDVSFIEDCAQPAAFNLVNSPSKAELEKQAEEQRNGSKLAIESFTAQESEHVEEENSGVAEISEAVDRESIKIAKEAVEAAATVNDKSDQMFQAFSINPSLAVGFRNGISTTSANATANLKEFLNETGVRFLDNLSNMGRRETVGKPRDSTIITPSRRMYVRTVLVPETLAVEKACGECVRTIEAQRQFLIEEEGKFNHHPPLAYREFMKQQSGETPERSLILQKLKTLKSVARLFARQSWYEWRKGFESNFRGELEHVLNSLKGEYVALEVELKKLTTANQETLEPKLVELKGELEHLKGRYESLSRSDWEEASKLHEIVIQQRQENSNLDAKLSETLEQETVLRQNIENVLEQRRILQDRLVQLKHACAQFEDCTELALTELKSTFVLQEALNGWRMVQLKEDSLAWEYTRGTPTNPIQIRMNWTNQNNLQVSSVLIESEMSSLSTLRPASQMVQPEFTGLPRAINSILCQLDSLVQLSRDLSLIKVQCDVQLLSVVAGPQLPLLLTFFNFEAKIKFDVIFGANLNRNGEMSFMLLSFQNHYGPVTQEMIQNSIKDDQKSLRRIVNTISLFLK